MQIRYSVVKSPCGNVIHTLMNTRDYKSKAGLPFLPGFVDADVSGEFESLSDFVGRTLGLTLTTSGSLNFDIGPGHAFVCTSKDVA